MKGSGATRLADARARDLFALAAGLWILASLGWPDAKVSLGLLGGSPGSATQGMNFYLAELGAAALGIWVCVDRRRRARVPRWGWAFAALASSVVALAAVQGYRMGWHPRDIAAEARLLAMLPGLLAVLSLRTQERGVLKAALIGGGALFALQQVLLLALEPKGLTNLNITPLPVVTVGHDLAQQSLLGLLVLLMGGLLWGRGRVWVALATGFWCLLWLSYLRALWITLPLAAGVAAFFLARAEGRTRALRYLAFQAGAALAGLLLCYGALSAFDPDSAFLFRFRLERTGQALKLLPPRPLQPSLPRGASALLVKGVARGFLYTPLGQKPKPDANRVDPSGFDRGFMRREALRGFKESPWLGQGLGALYRYQLEPGIQRLQRDPHNGYAWVAGKMGLLGLLAWAAVLGLGLRALWQRRNAGAAAFAACLALALLLDVFQCGALQPASLLPLLAALGVARGQA